MTTKNNLTKQELVAFDQVVEDFEEALVYTQLAENVRIGSEKEAVRSNDVLWRPMPIELNSQEGLDQTGNFVGHTELAVPVKVDRVRSVPQAVNSHELRDEHIMKRLANAAKQRLASDVNDAIRRQVAFFGSIVDVKAGKATGFDDLSRLMTKYDEQGLPTDGRIAVYSTRDMVNMASDLASRQTLTGKTQSAYEKAYINEIAGFDLLRDASAVQLHASTATGVTVSGANQRHIPKATVKNTATGDESNVDNRFMTLNVSVGSGQLQVGDAFTIAGVHALHHKNKNNTGELKTFRVVEVISPTQIKITPAIVADDYAQATQAEQAYKNVSATPASGAAITMLNKRASQINTNFIKGAIEFIPSTLAIDTKDGWFSTKATLSNGLVLYYSRQGDINNLSVKTRWDIVFGTALLNPEMAGIQLFNQG